MKPLAQRDPFRIGLVALVVGGLLLAAVVLVSVVSFGTTTYSAELEHSAGLREGEGEDVQVHGVSVGTVSSIEIQDQLVRVEFTVDDGIELGSQTSAAVKVATLLGTHYLEVDPAGDGDLPDDTIALARTSVPYNLQDVLNEGTAKLEELDPVELAKALAAASDTLDVAGDDVGPALEGVGRLSELVVKREDQTRGLLRAARAVAEQLDDSSDDIVGLMQQTNLVVDEITSRRAAIDRLLTETTSLSRALEAVVEQTDADVSPALDNLNLALDALNEQDRSLKRAIGVMAPAMRYLANIAGNGPYVDLNVQSPALPADDQLCALGDCS